jgi:hypothetical protein
MARSLLAGMSLSVASLLRLKPAPEGPLTGETPLLCRQAPYYPDLLCQDLTFGSIAKP